MYSTDIGLWKLMELLKTRGKRWDLPKLAIPLFKVMSSYFSNIHISDTQISHIIHSSSIYINAAGSCKRYPPSLPYIIIVQTCGKRWDLPKFVDVLSVNLGFSQSLIYIHYNIDIYIYTLIIYAHIYIYIHANIIYTYILEYIYYNIYTIIYMYIL